MGHVASNGDVSYGLPVHAMCSEVYDTPATTMRGEGSMTPEDCVSYYIPPPRHLGYSQTPVSTLLSYNITVT